MAVIRDRRVLFLAGWAAVTVILAVLPYIGLDAEWRRQFILVAIMSLVVSGVNLSYGFAGELALGQVAIYAAGAYTAGYVALNVRNDFIVTTLLAVAVALVIGALSGIPGLRLGGWMLTVTSFFLVILIPDVVNILKDQLGGYEGLAGIPLPAVFGHELDANQFYITAVIVLSIWFALFRNLVTSPYGVALRVLKQSPVLAASLGLSVFRVKLSAYAVAAVPAGLAGALFAGLDGFVSPTNFTLELVIAILAASIVSGSDSVYGVFLGAALLQLGGVNVNRLGDYTTVGYGLFLLAAGVLLPGGIAGVVRHYSKKIVRLPGAGKPQPPPQAAQQAVRTPDAPGAATGGPEATAHRSAAAFPTRSGKVLEIVGVGKSFGGNQALRDVTVTARPGEVTALIGPNGSGKTTLLNAISGLHCADSGTIRLGGESLMGLHPHQVAKRGVARTFQTPNIPSSLTTLQVVTAGSRAGMRVTMLESMLRLPRYWKAHWSDLELAGEILAQAGIEQVADVQASSLPLGTRRLVELARAMASGPDLLLLDEVASGLDTDELGDLREVIDTIRRSGVVVVLVEHNFPLIRTLADRVLVLNEGRVLVEGTPTEIEKHPDVLHAYLGAPAAPTTAADDAPGTSAPSGERS